MKRYFSCSLRGRDWWPAALTSMIAILFALIPFELVLMNLDSPHKNPLRSLTVAGCFAFGLCLALVVIFVAVRLFKILAPTVSLEDKKLSFVSKSRGLASFFSGHFEFAGDRIRFTRGGLALFKYFVFGLAVPFALWCFAFFSLGPKIDALKNTPKPDARLIASLSVLDAVVFFLLFFVAIPFGCLMIRWAIEVKTRETQVRFEGAISRAGVFVAIQTLLSIVTLGIYWPVQAIKTWKYFASHAAWKKQAQTGEEKGSAGFDGSMKKGFALLWAQAILCALTLGLYFPWAFARCADYFLGHTFVETK